MMIEYVMLALAILSIFLFIVSFFGKDEINRLEEQIDHLTISLAQETYQIKKRLQVLEEELLIPHENGSNAMAIRHDGLLSSSQKRVLFLYKQGLSHEQIARETALTTEEVRMILRGLAR
jgi:DNA-binding NarL/FixJ family response regulator